MENKKVKLKIVKEIDIEDIDNSLIFTKDFLQDGSVIYRARLEIEDIDKIFEVHKECKVSDLDQENIEELDSFYCTVLRDEIIRKIENEHWRISNDSN